MHSDFSYIEAGLKVLFGYSFLFIALPMFALKPWLKVRSYKNRLLASYVIGHAGILAIVFVLGFLKLCYEPLFVTLILSLTFGLRIFGDFPASKNFFNKFYRTSMLLLRKEYGYRLFFSRIKNRVFCSVKNFFSGIVLPNLPEVLVLLSLFVIFCIYYGAYGFTNSTFAAPDEEVHLYYIQAMLDGDIYTRGVYPFGFHNAGAALCMFFGIVPFEFIRITCILSIVMIMGMLYIWLRQLFTFKLAPLVAIALYNFAMIYSPDSIRRYQYALPQEYGMIFLCPMIIYLTAYFKHKRRRDLIMFGVSFALVFTCHFYTALAAGIACIAFAIIYSVRIIKKKMILPILLTGIISFSIAATPLAVGRIIGKPWEQAMNWATGVINDVDIYAEETAELLGTELEEEVVYTDLESRLEGILEMLRIIFFYSIKFLNIEVLIWFLMLIPPVLIFAIYCIKKRKYSETANTMFALIVMSILWIILASAEQIGFPEIMLPVRVAIFFAYFSVAFIAVPLELLYIAAKNNQILKTVMRYTAGIAVIVFLVAQQIIPSIHRYTIYNPIQTRGAMLSTLDITEQDERQTYTIISTTQEIGVISDNGFHYELIDLLLGQEFYEEDMKIHIPTPTIYTIIEKIPINKYAEDVSTSLTYEEYIKRPATQEEYAEEYFQPVGDVGDYYQHYRLLVMSRAAYWVEQFKTHYPESIDVYYEDDEVIVHRIEQDEYALYNLALDYGYNSRVTV